MPTSIASGTQAATVGTEHTLATDTTNKTYVLAVDAGAMVNGDELELRLYTIVLSAGTERLAFYAKFPNVQASPQLYSPPVPADISCKATLKQTAGTGRSFPWKLLSV
jgi:hypothetical protein